MRRNIKLEELDLFNWTNLFKQYQFVIRNYKFKID